MPIRHSIIHLIDKKPDGSPAVLHTSESELSESQARDNLLADLNESYNAKQGKAWGLFHEESGAYPLSGWLKAYINGDQDFTGFTWQAVEHLQKLMEESNLSTGGHVFFAHYQQGMTDYLAIALLHHSEGAAISAVLDVSPAKHLDLNQLHLAARINISEWQNNPKSRQYISFINSKNGRKASDCFRDFIGCQEGIDAPGETRTLLKAFSDFVESEDLSEEQAREKTGTLVGYATSQAKMGEPISLEELAALVDEDRPAAFYDFIRNKDYGLSPEIPADKRTLNQFRRFTARTEGLSISFEAHLLGNKVEFDQAKGQLVIRNLPTQLVDQLKRAGSAQSTASDNHVIGIDLAKPGSDKTIFNGAIDMPTDEELLADTLYPEAVAHVLETRRAGTSSIQRKLQIGYNRAFRLIERMEMEGIVTAIDSRGNREVIRHG